MDEDFLPVPNDEAQAVQPFNEPSPAQAEFQLFHDEAKEGTSSSDMVCETPEDDSYTSREQDEAYELGRWASWLGHIDDVTDVMLGNDNWDISIPYPEFTMRDEDFADAYDTETDPEKRAIFKKEYFRRQDREWCFACTYNIGEDKYPGFEVVNNLITTSLSTHTLNTTCNLTQDCYNKLVRPYLAKENGRPPRYWSRRCIRDHIMFHVPTIACDAELTFRKLARIEHDLHLTMIEVSQTTKKRVLKNNNVMSYIRVVKAKQDLYKFIQTMRTKKKKK